MDVSTFVENSVQGVIFSLRESSRSSRPETREVQEDPLPGGLLHLRLNHEGLGGRAQEGVKVTD